jgi:NAD(P)-dependent dehydrogenase (short-subunit alcohol dehydrogenase family)
MRKSAWSVLVLPLLALPGAYVAHPNLDQIPLGRLGLAQELANTYAFLSSEDASYITGQTFYVNGGEVRYP